MDICEKLAIQDYKFRLVFGRTRIDYDAEKDDANRTKHGYALESAVYLLQRIIFPFGSKPRRMP